MNQVLDRAVAAPLYKEVKRVLTQSLAPGEWHPGEALPSDAMLAQRYGVSIGTLRKAIDALVAEDQATRLAQLEQDDAA